MAELEINTMNKGNPQGKNKELNEKIKKEKEDSKKEKKSRLEKIHKKIGFWIFFLSLIVFIAVLLFMWLF